MSHIFIKTWSCTECGYKQDCEPTQENADLHFNNDVKFTVSDLKAEECPACALKSKRGKPLAKEINPLKKSKMNFMDETEHVVLIAALEADGPQQVSDGVEMRDETALEKNRRIEKDVEKLENLSNAEKSQARADLHSQPARQVQTNRMRDEFPHERKARIDLAKSELKPLTDIQIAELRAKFEDN